MGWVEFFSFFLKSFDIKLWINNGLIDVPVVKLLKLLDHDLLIVVFNVMERQYVSSLLDVVNKYFYKVEENVN